MVLKYNSVIAALLIKFSEVDYYDIVVVKKILNRQNISIEEENIDFISSYISLSEEGKIKINEKSGYDIIFDTIITKEVKKLIMDIPNDMFTLEKLSLINSIPVPNVEFFFNPEQVISLSSINSEESMIDIYKNENENHSFESFKISKKGVLRLVSNIYMNKYNRFIGVVNNSFTDKKNITLNNIIEDFVYQRYIDIVKRGIYTEETKISSSIFDINEFTCFYSNFEVKKERMLIN